MTAPATISAAEVRAHLDYPSLIDRLGTAFGTGCAAPLRHRLELAEGAAMLFKSVGTAVEGLAAAELVWERASK